MVPTRPWQTGRGQNDEFMIFITRAIKGKHELPHKTLSEVVNDET